MHLRIVWASVASFLVASVAAQEPPADRLFVVRGATPLPAFSAQIDIVGGEGGVPGPVVKGKPYSARSITESTQVLADGNRITQRNEAVVYRDAEGRSRREQTLRDLGLWQTSSPLTVINIHDPVAGKSFVLDPDAKTAREVRPLQMAFVAEEAMTGVVGSRAAGPEAAAEGPVTAIPVPAPQPGATDASITVIQQAEASVAFGAMRGMRAGVAITAPLPAGATGAYEPGEDLGEQVLEGLLVRGTRMTDTIPAGLVGNERPIEIVTERWYSPDIDAIVLHRFSDPRFGETIYRLVGVVRGEPSPDLFQVPQGYELQAMRGPEIGLRALPPLPALPATPGQRVDFTLQRAEPAPVR